MSRLNFAWVNAGETTFLLAHQREDEKIASLNVEHDEADFAIATIVIKNPRVGFLHASRKQWAWISDGATPLFFGRLVSIPTSISKEAVTLEFQARPADFQDQKDTLADTMRDLPEYDPVWFTLEAQLEADTVLEARAQRWHIDRVAHTVSASHILVGEDGLAEFAEEEIPYDSLEINIAQVPGRTLQVVGNVTWDQADQNTIDLGPFDIHTYTGKSLISQWPKEGTNIGGGWSVVSSSITDNYNVETTNTRTYSATWSNEAAEHNNGDTLSMSMSSTIVVLPGDPVTIPLTSQTVSSEGKASSASTAVTVAEYRLTGKLVLGYEAGRNRKEGISFTMSANFQDLITLPGDEDVSVLSISGGDVGIPIDSVVPIGDPRNRSYFTTDRGLRSLEWLILRGRAQLLMSSRAVEVTCAIPWARAIALSCRKNGSIHDPRLPGGVATGKIVKYGFSSDGDAATRIGTVTIGCPIGHGGTVAPVAGTPDYVDTDYVNDDYQYFTGSTVVLNTDIGYTPPAFDNSVDDGLHFPLTYVQAVKTAEIVGSVVAQKAFLTGLIGSPHTLVDPRELEDLANRADMIPKQIEEGLSAIPHKLHLVLANLEAGPFDNVFDIEVTDLEIPQGINLSAAPL